MPEFRYSKSDNSYIKSDTCQKFSNICQMDVIHCGKPYYL